MSEIDDIRRQMAQIRHDLHQDVSTVVGGVSEVVTGVGEVMDWRSVVRNHPFAVTSAALAIGYLIVPRRAKRVTQISPSSIIAAPASVPAAPRKKPFRPMSWALSLLWPIATQVAQSYAMLLIENQLRDYLQRVGPDRRPPEQNQPGHDLPYGTSGRLR